MSTWAYNYTRRLTEASTEDVTVASTNDLTVESTDDVTMIFTEDVITATQANTRPTESTTWTGYEEDDADDEVEGNGPASQNRSQHTRRPSSSPTATIAGYNLWHVNMPSSADLRYHYH
ncbi:hypothetical protein LY76DRAFT_606183 [Colletotrichum caudatum]|nr:hypothetical protein LY76DRAFT_606183 [Colletotrichum caudatum]